MSRIRPPAVAGLFYPSDPAALRDVVERCLAEGRARRAGEEKAPKALIVPHAGYVYSGPVAGTAYALLEPLRERIRRVVLIGPSHRVAFGGLALSSADAFATPLGDVPLDVDAAARLAGVAGVGRLDQAHASEHSLEVQLPFLQVLLEEFVLVPIAAGSAEPDAVAAALETLWGDGDTLLLVSSDLSHYFDYETARRLDRETTRAIETLRPESVGEESACGRVPVRGLLVAAKRHGLAARTLDLRSSGDTAGPRDRVVGYGAWAFA